jgi:hypothetical protein
MSRTLSLLCAFSLTLCFVTGCNSNPDGPGIAGEPAKGDAPPAATAPGDIFSAKKGMKGGGRAKKAQGAPAPSSALD